jgi:antirestriction protein
MEAVKLQQETKPEPKIYVANLEAYNNGRMVGDWVTPTDYASYDDFNQAIQKATKYADEIAVHDYDYLPSSMGEYPDIEGIYDFCHQIENSYLCLDALIAYAEYMCDSDVTKINFDDAEDLYCGKYNHFQDYAEYYFDECGDGAEIEKLPESLQYHFDMHSYARDLQHDYHVVERGAPHYGVFVFQA